MHKEQRATPRRPVLSLVDAVLFFGARPFAGRIVDISEGGARLELNKSVKDRLPESLTVGSRVMLVVKTDNDVVECEVRRIGAGELGLQFFDRASRAQRREFLARIAG